MEKKKQYIVYLLFLVSILMLAVPVVPHHHHGSEAICLKNDLHTGCSEATHAHHHHPAGHPNCCHDKGCLTHQFVQRTPRVERQTPQPRPILLPADFSTFLKVLSPYSEQQSDTLYSPYVESLHGIRVVCASGLRAPPSVLA